MCRTCHERFPALPYLSIPATFHRGTFQSLGHLRPFWGQINKLSAEACGNMLKSDCINLPLKKLLISPCSKELLKNMTRTCIKDPTQVLDDCFAYVILFQFFGFMCCVFFSPGSKAGIMWPSLDAIDTSKVVIVGEIWASLIRLDDQLNCWIMLT